MKRARIPPIVVTDVHIRVLYITVPRETNLKSITRNTDNANRHSCRGILRKHRYSLCVCEIGHPYIIL